MTIAMPQLFSTRTALVLQGTIVLMALNMPMSFHVLWERSAVPLVCLVSVNAVHAQVVTTVTSWDRQPTRSNAIKVRK